MFGVDIFGVDVEVVSSPGYLMRCSRFDTIRELLQGEDAFRFLGRIVVPQKLGRFITADYGRGVGGVISKSSNKKILHLNAYLSFLGISLTADLFITEKHLLTYIEGNVWNTFLAQLDIEAKSGRNWYELIYEVRGRFVARADRKRRQTQSQSKFFQASYFDAIKKVIQNTADWADQRISDAQDKLSQSEEKLTKAQKWFDEKKDDLRKANEVFDSTIKKLERVKDDFERAKEPYRRSLEKLTEAQRKVDNLCRIRSCRTFCIPGLKCKVCYKGFFGIPYPCCRYTDCMISFPDPICVAKNVLCGVVRLAAFAALEAAKVFARAPMIVFDAAKAAVSIAQFAVDKSRVVLKLAEGILQVAQLGLEAAKTTLRIAIVALEALKIAIGVAAQILQMVITYGVQNLVDVKNCGFRVQLSTFDLQAFEVGCDVNLFQLGWIPIKMKINFKNPIASLWSAAKATVDEVVKIFDISFGKRKRRDVTLHTSNKIVRALRRARAAGNDTDYFQLLNDTASLFNSSIDISNVTMGFEETSSNVDNSDYDNRRSIFSSKCSIFNVHYKFLTDTIGTLSTLANDTKFSLDMVKGEAKWDKEYNVQVIAENITLANANISIDYAKNYNLTEEDLEEAMTDAKILMMNDEYLHDINRVASSSKATIQAEVDSVDINMFIDSWMMALENITGGHFNESDCVDFRDCLLHSLSTLYDLFSGDEQSDISEIEPILDEIADIIFSIVQNSTLSLDEMYNSTVYMKQTLARLNDHNIYCSEAPVFKSPLANVTIYEGGKAVFLCDVTAYPDPIVWWFKDNKVMDSAMSNRLEIVNTSLADIATYMCRAGNIVANLTSNVAYLLLWVRIPQNASKNQTKTEYKFTSLIMYKMYIFKMITTYNTMSGSKCPLRSTKSTKSIECMVSGNHKRSRKIGVQTLLNGLKSQQIKCPSISE
ncbi:hypothetical protein FSP39_008881 [Pinctada imbricata]|uniref:Ig-like domain-containing protein n=1 Tax=Pinctada imbricata TaxID=66713 RepID=A0AA88YC34_PINIB|nr:hypothetical protein FSP39_008881 [Pinctada imbricata]